MYYLTENAFQPAMIGLLAAFAAWTFWFMTKKKALLVAAIAVVVGTLGIIVIELLIVTDAEQLRTDLYHVAGAVQSNDLDSVLEYISPQAEHLVAEAKFEMSQIVFKKLSVNRLSDPEIDLTSTPPTASISFNAIVGVDCSQSKYYGNIPHTSGATRATLNYEKDSQGKWKIVSYDYKPLTTNDLMGTK